MEPNTRPLNLECAPKAVADNLGPMPHRERTILCQTNRGEAFGGLADDSMKSLSLIHI